MLPCIYIYIIDYKLYCNSIMYRENKNKYIVDLKNYVRVL